MTMGATSPVTAAGSLIQGYAEVLAGLALTQLWEPAAPVVMGLFAIPFSMRSMQPVFDDPVTQLVSINAVQLARHLGVPVRGDGGVTSAHTDDAQAGYEGSIATYFATASKSDFVLNSAGWLEGGRCMSMAKLSREVTAIWNQGHIDMPKSEPPPIPLDKELSTALCK
jgi:trimethylamine--corrinoid protein Co-methyltransferase